jgi:hypothetical protein
VFDGVLGRNWKVYKDPTFDRSAAEDLFGRSEMMGSVAPIGPKLQFKVKSIEKLRWLYKQSNAGTSPIKRELTGVSVGNNPGDEDRVVATFRGSEFRIVAGCGLIQTGVYELEDLGSNEPYEEFLLGLLWRSHRGWMSEMHVLGIVADDDVEVIDE